MPSGQGGQPAPVPSATHLQSTKSSEDPARSDRTPVQLSSLALNSRASGSSMALLPSKGPGRTRVQLSHPS